MRTAGKIIAVLMLVLGAVWILQGFNILPGSFMTGQRQWAAYGGLLCVAGLVVWMVSRKGSGTSSRP